MVIHLRKLVVCIALPLIVGWISSLITQGSMEVFETINKPYLSPPGWVFPVVWTILYILMGIASYIVLTSGQSQYKINTALAVYLIQLAFNFVWPIIFFNAQKYLLAFVWLIVLWVLILITTVLFGNISKTAGKLMIPYLLWVTFAGYLNYSIYMLN